MKCSLSDIFNERWMKEMLLPKYILIYIYISLSPHIHIYISIYGIFLLLIAGEIRCHCNESGCISTGYMCKSRLGMCYSLLQREEMDINENTLSVHGCAENLRTAHRDLCSDNSKGQSNDIIRTSTSLEGEFSPLLLCCKKDMCNYEKNMRSVQFATNTQSNGSIQRGKFISTSFYINNRWVIVTNYAIDIVRTLFYCHIDDVKDVVCSGLFQYLSVFLR